MGWLFSGDLYINNKQDVAFESENITHTIRTIETILNLNFDTFFCFHAGIVEHGKKMFQQKLDFFLKLQESVIKLRKMGLNSKDIDDRLFPRKHVITSVSKGEWSSINMVKTL